MQEIQEYTLSNGIRVVHRQVTHTAISHIGIMLDMGSRDEKPHQQGLAHFWEHMAFKGTKKRTSLQIINRLEIVGGELNAYTTKEKICFHASVLTPHYERALELLADITFNSNFPDKQVERERGVILEEMAMYYDSPEDAIQDDFDDIVFAHHQLGKNTLGNQESVSNFKRQDLLDFINENLDTERVIFSSIGNLPFKKVIQLVEKFLKDIPAKSSNLIRTPPINYTPQNLSVTRSITQAHVAIGRTSYPLADDKRLPFFMLVNLLGGFGMNSRLNLAVRERNGLVYTIDAGYTPFIDTGYWGIYFATEVKRLGKVNALILKELKKLREVTLTKTQLVNTKEQLMGQMAMSEEGNMSFMLMMAKSLLDINRIDSLEYLFQQIQGVTAIQLQDLANEMFQEQDLSSLTFLPE
ncbi:M16 family metallopeptidase [Arcicella rigui]|jgi:predicted Zn-dependent peptidase|uniref:Pitrilysin family protein n=1 Tax=Arcicella rigui TaxID=797020 RepID=A0ABU5Q8Y5_9BACT|nr:pitrilysin family protein [Arcicella rigui]MEA5139301.1 pitrilysin family protein [Arcicella rigui]